MVWIKSRLKFMCILAGYLKELYNVLWKRRLYTNEEKKQAKVVNIIHIIFHYYFYNSIDIFCIA